MKNTFMLLENKDNLDWRSLSIFCGPAALISLECRLQTAVVSAVLTALYPLEFEVGKEGARDV